MQDGQHPSFFLFHRGLRGRTPDENCSLLTCNKDQGQFRINAQIDEGLLRVISLDSLISPEYTNNRADWRNACYSLSLFRFIQRAGHFGEVGGGDMGVAQGGFNGAMPKQFLDPAQVGAAFQQVRRETMP